MMVCSCANPACMVNGCMQANELRRQYHQKQNIFPSMPTQVLTPELIRQIVREELAKAQGENND